MTAPQPGEIEVEDQLGRRIRKPVDLLRCVLSCIGIVALAVASIAASATMSGVETDIVGASRRLPHALLIVVPPLALFALLMLPVAMAVQLLVRRQFRRLAEAAATGVLAAAVTAVANDLLARPAANRLYYAIIMARPGTSHAAALDPYLAGLVAYATMVGLAGWPYWRNALWAAIAVYAIVHIGALHTSVLTLLITLLGGRAIGLAVGSVAGSASQRPGALEIVGALAAVGLPVTAIQRAAATAPARETHRATTRSRARETAAGWTSSCPTGTSRRQAPSTGCTGGCGCAGRCHATPRCRWSTRWSAGPCCLTRPRRGRAHAAAARRGPGRSRSLRAGL